MNSTTYRRRLLDLQARSAETDRQAAAALEDLRQATADAVAAADAMLAAIAAAPAPEVQQ